MEINLLPRRSPLEKYRTLLLLGTSAALFGALLAAVFYDVDLSNRILNAQMQLTRVTSENVIDRSERTNTAQDKVLHDIETDVTALTSREHDYGVMLDGIAAQLSDKTILVSANLDSANQTLSLNLQAESIKTIAEYAVLLRQQPWVQDVFVGEIHNDLAAQQDQNSPSADASRKMLPYSAGLVIHLQPAQAGVAPANNATKK